MKIAEFIEKVNDSDTMRAKEVDKRIVIGTPNNMGIFSIPEDATNLIEIDTWATSNSLYWKKPDREYLSALIEEFLHTPVKERFPEKELVLCLGKNDYGQKVYLTKTHDPRKIGTTMNADCFTEWSDQEIQGLIELFPKLAPIIYAMKKEAKDDGEQD